MILEEILLVKDYWHFNRLLQTNVHCTFDVVISKNEILIIWLCVGNKLFRVGL